MGNASVREDGDSPSGVGDEEDMESAPGGAYYSYRAHGGPPEPLGQSPPQSPSSVRSPLMFTPQVPIAPLQRSDETQNPSPAWTENITEYKDMSCEQGIPTVITWSYGGKEVAVEGSWDNWKTKKHLQRSGKDFTIVKVLPSGNYQYRLIVDGQYRYAPDVPWGHDDMGNACNILDLQDYVPEDVKSISGFEPPQSPESSYNKMNLSSEDFAKEPPFVPPHLQMTLLNLPSSYMENPSLLTRPQHVALNHLFMQKGDYDQPVVALGSTHRFLAKYVTVVLYKSLQR